MTMNVQIHNFKNTKGTLEIYLKQTQNILFKNKI